LPGAFILNFWVFSAQAVFTQLSVELSEIIKEFDALNMAIRARKKGYQDLSAYIPQDERPMVYKSMKNDTGLQEDEAHWKSLVFLISPQLFYCACQSEFEFKSEDQVDRLIRSAIKNRYRLFISIYGSHSMPNLKQTINTYLIRERDFDGMEIFHPNDDFEFFVEHDSLPLF
jgi:hypothetical protein